MQKCIVAAAVVLALALGGALYVTLSSSNDGVEASIAADVIAVVSPSPRARSFEAWAEAYVSATDLTPEARAELEQEGLALAAARTESMVTLIQRDPATALKNALRPGLVLQLPASVAAQTEVWVTGMATLEMLCPYQVRENGSLQHDDILHAHADHDHDAADGHVHTEAIDGDHGAAGPMPHEHEYEYNIAFTHGPYFQAHVYGRRINRPARVAFPMYGVALGGHMAVSDLSMRQLDPEEIAAVRAEQVQPDPVADIRGDVIVQKGQEYFGFVSQMSFDNYHTLVRREEQETLESKAFINFRTEQPLNVIVFLIKFADEQAACTTTESYSGAMNTADGFWQSASYYYTSIISPITYVYISLAQARTAYNTGGACPISNGKSSGLDRDTWTAATAQGYTESNYDRYIIVFSTFAECQWAGLGSIANTGVWVNGRFDPVEHWHVVAHELGHNFGLKHANMWYGGGTSPIGAGGQSLPYGDNFDIMGAVNIDTNRFTFHPNAEKKWGLNWIPDSDITLVSTSGVFRVFTHDRTDASGNRAVYVKQGTSTTYYWMEYRTSLCYSPARPYFLNGLNIHWAYATAAFEYETNLLDLTPPYVSASADDNSNNSPLALGTTFSDTTANIHMTPVLIGTSNGLPYIDVVVNLNVQGNHPPGTPTVSFGCSSPEVGEAVLVLATVSDQDNDELAFSWDFGDGSASTINAQRVSHAWGAAQAYSVVVTVSDMKGGVTASAAASITIKPAGQSACPPCPNACSDQGQCSGGQCACSPGWTGADCSRALRVDSVVLNYDAVAGGSIVTVTGQGFSGGNPPATKCLFVGVKQATATGASDTQVTCVVPRGATNGTIALEMTNDGGLSVSNSKKTFTYGGGLCAQNCTGRGLCEVGPAICHCYLGFTGSICQTNITVRSFTPSFGPSIGNTVVTLNVTGFSSNMVPQCQFGELAPVSGTYSGGLVTCTAPALGGTADVMIRASPNGGVDWTTDIGPYSYQAITQLYDGLTSASVALTPGQLAFFQMPVSVANATITVQLSAATGSGMAYMGTTTVPYPTSFTDSTTAMKVMTTGLPGTVYFTVAATVAGSFTITVTSAGVISLPYNFAVTGSAQAGSPRYFSLNKGDTTYALRISITSLSPSNAAEPMLAISQSAAQPTLTSADTATGTSLLLQYCNLTGVYNIGVFSDTTVGFFIKVQAFATSSFGTTPYTGVGVIGVSDRLENELDIRFGFASDPSDYDFNLQYTIWYRLSQPLVGYATSCDVRNTATQFGTATTFSALNYPEVKVINLSPSTNYEISVIVTNSLGIESSYPMYLAERTKPPPLPTNLLIAVGVGCIVVALLAGGIVAYIKLGGKKKKKGPKKYRDQAATRDGPRTRGQARPSGPRAPGVRQANTGPVNRDMLTVSPGMGAEAAAPPEMVDPRRDGRRAGRAPRNGGPSGGGGRSGRSGGRSGGGGGGAAPASPAPADPGRVRRSDQRAAQRAQRMDTQGGVEMSPMPASLSAPPPAYDAAPAPASGTGGQQPGGPTDARRSKYSASAVDGQILGIAKMDFTPQFDNELGFKTGDQMKLLKDLKDGWLQAEINGRVGLVPAAYVKKVKVVRRQ